MKETKTAKTTTHQEEDEPWPPPPTNLATNLEAVPTRFYLTSSGWLDTVVGIVIGITFWWFFSYGIMRYIMYYTLPHKLNFFHRVDFFWNVMVSCIITLLASILVWAQLRRFYRRLANTILYAGIAFGCLLMYFFY